MNSFQYKTCIGLGLGSTLDLTTSDLLTQFVIGYVFLQFFALCKNSHTGRLGVKATTLKAKAKAKAKDLASKAKARAKDDVKANVNMVRCSVKTSKHRRLLHRCKKNVEIKIKNVKKRKKRDKNKKRL